MKHMTHRALALPDIAAYAGDTTPWELELVYTDGCPFPKIAAEGGTITLTMLPYSMAMIQPEGEYDKPTPVVIKEGTTKSCCDSVFAVFDFDRDDTISFSGKYIYQVEVVYGEDRRIGQASVWFRRNLNL